MESIWTESAEAVLVEQSWQRFERERHQRLLHQLKLELQQVRGRRQQAVVASIVVTPVVVAPVAIAPAVPNDSVPVTQPEPPAPAQAERVFRHPKKSVLSVQIR